MIFLNFTLHLLNKLICMTIPLFQRLLLWIFSDTISGILILENDSFLPFCSCFSLKQNINEMAFLKGHKTKFLN